MSAAQVVGALLIALTFVPVSVLMVRTIGWLPMIGVWCFIASTVGVVMLGTYLLTGSLR